MSKSITCLLLLAFVASTIATPAYGILVFRKEFEEKYKVKDPQTDAEQQLSDAASKAKCYICHVKGEDKEVRNEYGEALAKYLDDDNFSKERRDAEPEKVKQEIWEGLEKVEADKNAAGETFGDLLRAGKLPVPLPSDE
jgi:hypothetical protein